MLAIFRKSYPILLGFSEDELYLISRFYNISLGFPKDIKPCGLYPVALTNMTSADFCLKQEPCLTGL